MGNVGISDHWGKLGGNFGMGVPVSSLKPTPIIYLVFEKNGPLIYLIEQNVYIFIYFSLILNTLFAVCKQSLQINITILVSMLNM